MLGNTPAGPSVPLSDRFQADFRAETVLSISHQALILNAATHAAGGGTPWRDGTINDYYYMPIIIPGLPAGYTAIVLPPILGMITYKAVNTTIPGWRAVRAVELANAQQLIAQGTAGMLPTQNPGITITPGAAALGTAAVAAIAYGATGPSAGAAFVSIGQQISQGIAAMNAQLQFNSAEAATGGLF